MNGEISNQKEPQSAKNGRFMDKPWFQQAYQMAKDFYAKDEALDPKDRLELSKMYVGISRAQLWGGWVGFAVVFGGPFGYQWHRTGAIKGVKVPRNFVLGLVAMALSAHGCGRVRYNAQVARLAPLAQTSEWDNEVEQPAAPQSRETRQYEMLKLLGYGMAPRWGHYFYSTYTNPERRLPNPSTLLKKMQSGEQQPQVSPFLNQRDPMGLYSGPGHDKKEGITPHREPTDLGESRSSWDKVRVQSGVNSSNSGSGWDQLRMRPQDGPDADDADDTDEFNELMERERRGEDTI
ncbi:LADA_0F10880g1_1 [Lachancea dasiensis]|uniref:LADA_0F10880g1_1 n=1 Tax=Lachancea dasiensis TaxID=1072105 RepID=A0A1G4JLU3_9SACH|nr:LADA_0F10880g1_1 [Lachancea dasiensis]